VLRGGTGQRQAVALLRRHGVLTSVLAPIEISSALGRHRHQGQLSEREHAWILARFQRERPFWMMMEVDARVLARAEDLAGSLPIRTLDVVHLASALTFQEETGLRIPFITADRRQHGAAAERKVATLLVG
jgi:predicted nucleic acid-binding protein